MSQKIQFDTCHTFANKSGHNLFEEVKFGIWHLIGHIRQRKSRNCNLRRAIIKSAVSCANNSGRLLFTGNTNSRQAGKCQISWVLTEFPLALKVKLLKKGLSKHVCPHFLPSNLEITEEGLKWVGAGDVRS